LKTNAREIKEQNKKLVELREEKREHDQELEDVRAEQAKIRSSVMQKEKKIKKADKALEGKVWTWDTHPMAIKH
jgi:structural maintenance of chromosome 1